MNNRLQRWEGSDVLMTGQWQGCPGPAPGPHGEDDTYLRGNSEAELVGLLGSER